MKKIPTKKKARKKEKLPSMPTLVWCYDDYAYYPTPGLRKAYERLLIARLAKYTKP